MNCSPDEPLTPRAIGAAAGIFVAAFWLANRLHARLCSPLIHTECLPYWPVSQMALRRAADANSPGASQIIFAALAVVLFVVALRVLEKTRYPPWLAAAFGLALILATTLTHGITSGLEQPVAGPGLTKTEYFRFAAGIVDPLAFVRGFETYQPERLGHVGTHPPGAVLLFYLLRTLTGSPLAIALFLAVAAVGLTALVFRVSLAPQADDPAIGRTLFLLFLVPAIQIYYAASLDALIAPLMLGSVLWMTSASPGRRAAATVCLILVSTLTFTFLFILPIAAVMVGKGRASWRHLLAQIGALAVFWVAVYALLGYNYLHSFAIASALENPDGFRLLSTPGDYLMTRVEDVGEILLFLGPAVAMVIARAYRQGGRQDPLVKLSAAAIGSLLLVFLTGAYRTGETARGAMFIYPFLMLPAAIELARPPVARQYSLLAGLTFAQSLLMQMAGGYFW